MHMSFSIPLPYNILRTLFPTMSTVVEHWEATRYVSRVVHAV
jgi:hypothetical protein